MNKIQFRNMLHDQVGQSLATGVQKSLKFTHISLLVPGYPKRLGTRIYVVT